MCARAVAVASLACLVLSACGGDDGGDSGSSGGDDILDGAPPSQDLVATAIRRTDPATFVLNDTGTADYLEAAFGAKWGLAAASRTCAVGSLLDSVGSGQPVTAYLSGESGNQAEAEAAQACSTAEDSARSESDEPAPDLDLDSARGALGAFAAAQAQAAELSADEAACYGTTLAGSLTDDQVVALFARRGFESDLDLGTVVAECVPADRLHDLATAIAEAATTTSPDSSGPTETLCR